MGNDRSILHYCKFSSCALFPPWPSSLPPGVLHRWAQHFLRCVCMFPRHPCTGILLCRRGSWWFKVLKTAEVTSNFWRVKGMLEVGDCASLSFFSWHILWDAEDWTKSDIKIMGAYMGSSWVRGQQLGSLQALISSRQSSLQITYVKCKDSLVKDKNSGIVLGNVWSCRSESTAPNHVNTSIITLST